MENSVELTQNLQVTASENTNNSEIEAKSIEEENKISEEVTAETSKKEEKEVKTLDTNKPFKWTNEATKAAACMLKDIIDDYEKSSNSASLDEEISDPWGYAKLDKQMNLIKQSKEFDLFPETFCRYKLVSLLDKYFIEHTKIINSKLDIHEEIIKTNEEEYCFIKYEYDFYYLYFVFSKLALENIHLRDLIKEGIEYYERFDDDDYHPDLTNYSEYSDDYIKYIKNIETDFIAKDIDCSFNDFEEVLERLDTLPMEFRYIYLEDLFRKQIKKNLPNIDEIDPIYGFKKKLNQNQILMLGLAKCSYRKIDFLNLADAFLADQINGLKGLKETYADMFC